MQRFRIYKLGIALILLFSLSTVGCGDDQCPNGQTRSDGHCVPFSVATFRGCITGQVQSVSSEDRVKVEAVLKTVVGAGVDINRIDKSTVGSDVALRIIDVCEKLIQANPVSGPVTGVNNAQVSTTEIPISGCRLTVKNSFATILEEPSPLSRQLIKINSGTYSPQAYVINTFANTKMLWFKISTQDRTGWLRDDSFNVDSKTKECP